MTTKNKVEICICKSEKIRSMHLLNSCQLQVYTIPIGLVCFRTFLNAHLTLKLKK